MRGENKLGLPVRKKISGYLPCADRQELMPPLLRTHYKMPSSPLDFGPEKWTGPNVNFDVLHGKSINSDPTGDDVLNSEAK